MLIVERHFTKGNPELLRLCGLAKDLYNRANFIMRQSWFSQRDVQGFRSMPGINVLVGETHDLPCFQDFGNTKIAKQVIRRVLTDWSNFYKALRAFKRDPSKFDRYPRPPRYKDQLAQVTFYNETIKGGQSGRDLTRLTATNDCFSVKSDRPYKQVIVTPKHFGFIIEVQYEKNHETPDVSKPKLSRGKVCTIDLGLNNLAAVTLDQQRPILVNGRIVKSINQWYNKRPCKSRARKRYFRLENYFHHTAKMIVELCVHNGIGNIIVGRNAGWKRGVNMGKRNNQSFQFVPHESLIEKIRYRAEMLGIEFVLTEEAYTSQASFYDRDPLPRYGEAPPEFSGRRKHRGLYVGKDGFAINADINASLNIGRKVIPESLGIGDRSVAATPVVVNPLKWWSEKDHPVDDPNLGI